MTLLFMDGFTNCGIAGFPKPAWTGVLGSLTGRDGVANGAAGTTNAGAVCNIGAADTFFMGLAFQPIIVNDVFGVPTTGLSLRNAGVAQLSFVWTAAGYLQLRLGSKTGPVLATATSGEWIANQWRQFQIKATFHTSAGVCEVKVDGETVISYSGQTSTVSGPVHDFIIVSNVTGFNRFAFDDLWVCDGVDGTATDGRPNNNFLGDLSVKALRPTAAGDSTGFTPSTAPNWGAVDENPPNTTDYVSAVEGSGLRDLYQISDLPATGFDTVYAVQQTSYAAKSDAGVATLEHVIKENSVVTKEPVAFSLSTTYNGNVGILRKLKPSGGVWSIADVNALQIGLEA